MNDNVQARSDPEMGPIADLFRAAAAMLIGGIAAEGPPRDLLSRLDYLDGAAELAQHRAAMLRAASCFSRIFTLEEAHAPGLIALGAEVNPAAMGVRDAPLASVSGAGLTFRQAFDSCVGEGVEHLSQYVTDADAIQRLTAEEALAGASPAMRDLWKRLLHYRRDRSAPRTAWTVAADLADGQPVRVPADLCFRRPAGEREIDPPWPLSSGCAAGPDHLAATLHGLFELVERDAVALWWRGGRRGRLPPSGVGAAVLAQLRGNSSERRTWLLDITNDCGIPAVVAASCNNDGFGLCCGFAARATIEDAAEAAARELAQMEVAHSITSAKRAVRGEAALNEVDHRHLLRFSTINVAETPALHPLAPPLPPSDLPANNARAALLEARKRLSAIGLAPCAVDLTRAAFGIPVVRVICPGLEAGMTSAPGPRLRSAAQLSGVDPTAAVPL
jgi:ribosomal protein S12 methylthiotransferase accessory factor